MRTLHIIHLPHRDDRLVGLMDEFSDTALYTIAARFYDRLLALEPGLDFDRQLAGQGLFKVCQPVEALQHIGYSVNSRRLMDLNRPTDW